MKNKAIIITLIAVTSLVFSGAYVSADPLDTPVSTPSSSASAEPTPSATPNIDTLSPPSQEMIEQNLWSEVSVDPAPDNSEIDPASQDEPETWAVVDENGNTLNVIVCDRDYCGSGWIPTRYDGFTAVEFARVVLQGARDPQTGNSNGGHWGNYNFPSNTWTQTNPDNSVYQMPVEYGAQPICIELCPTPEPTPSPSPTSGDSEGTTPEITPTVVQERVVSIEPNVINNKIVINETVKEVVLEDRVIIIATKGNKKKIWVYKMVKNSIIIKIPIKYLSWKISFKYTVE